MSDRTETSYARCADGGHLAYRVIGSGEVFVLDVVGFGASFSIDSSDDLPHLHGFEDELGRFCRLIRFDPRGVGASDPRPGAVSTESWVEDLLTVLDAVGAGQVAVLGSSFGAVAALALAARRPERVSSLVLVNAFARITTAPGYGEGLPLEVFDEVASTADPDRETVSEIDAMAPSVAGDSDVRRWWTRESRRGATPASAAAFWDWLRTADTRTDAQRLTQPALIMWTADNQFLEPRFSQWLAANVPGAEQAELRGADQLMWAISDPTLVPRIEEFFTGSRSQSTSRGTLAAILFTDIVDSTATNTREGNRAWLDRLARHDRVVERQIRLFGGTHIKNMGDGVIATFPTPTQAIESARNIQHETTGLGIDVRAAVHVAEIEERNNDILGLGVTIAARVLNHANAGEIVTSPTVTQALTGSPHTFTPRGAHTLKGVPGDWPLYVLDDELHTAAPTGTR